MINIKYFIKKYQLLVYTYRNLFIHMLKLMKIKLTPALPCGAPFNKVKSLVVLSEPRSNKFETLLSLSGL